MYHDAFLSPLLDPLEGLSMLNCGKLELEGRSQLPTLKGVEGCAKSPEIRLGRGTSIISLESTSKINHKRVSSHSRTPLGVGTSHGHFDTFDSPRPDPRGKPPPSPVQYFLQLYVEVTSKWLFFPGLPRRSPETVSGQNLKTLGAHISRLRHPIGVRSKPKLQLSSRAFQRHVTFLLQTLG